MLSGGDTLKIKGRSADTSQDRQPGWAEAAQEAQATLEEAGIWAQSPGLLLWVLVGTPPCLLLLCRTPTVCQALDGTQDTGDMCLQSAATGSEIEGGKAMTSYRFSLWVWLSPSQNGSGPAL